MVKLQQPLSDEGRVYQSCWPLAVGASLQISNAYNRYFESTRPSRGEPAPTGGRFPTACAFFGLFLTVSPVAAPIWLGLEQIPNNTELWSCRDALRAERTAANRDVHPSPLERRLAGYTILQFIMLFYKCSN
jgi:hypothetical protein